MEEKLRAGRVSDFHGRERAVYLEGPRDFPLAPARADCKRDVLDALLGGIDIGITILWAMSVFGRSGFHISPRWIFDVCHAGDNDRGRAYRRDECRKIMRCRFGRVGELLCFSFFFMENQYIAYEIPENFYDYYRIVYAKIWFSDFEIITRVLISPDVYNILKEVHFCAFVYTFTRDTLSEETVSVKIKVRKSIFLGYFRLVS